MLFDVQTSKVSEYCYASDVMWFVDIFVIIVRCDGVLNYNMFLMVRVSFRKLSKGMQLDESGF